MDQLHDRLAKAKAEADRVGFMNIVLFVGIADIPFNNTPGEVKKPCMNLVLTRRV